MKKWSIRILAVIGLLSIAKWLFNAVRMQVDAGTYLINCEKVEPGMPLDQAKQIMGDYDWYERVNRSEIWTINGDTAKMYYLSYPTPALASEETAIIFDPVTQVVTGVICGESSKAEQ